MTVAAVTNLFSCPGCSTLLELVSPGPAQCMQCRWSGDVFPFTPRMLAVQEAVAALPEDATCMHHPRKKAVGVCAGTGDYICALCAIELNGQIYSAEYLNTAGKTLAGKVFDRTLARPDNQITLYLICCFIPYVNFVMVPLAFVWIPHAVFLYLKLLRSRRESQLLTRVVGRGRLILLPVLIGLFALGWIIGVVVVVSLTLTRRF